jgi:cytochrome b561
LRFEGLEGAARGSLIRLHKSIGFSVLLITGLRVLVRLRGPLPPPLDEGWRRRLATGVRYGFYALLLLIPLSGWSMISAARPLRPTWFFGLFVWPALRPLAELPPGARTAAHDALAAIHLGAALLLVLLLATHVAGAVSHRSRDGALPIRRMRPF